MQATRLSRFTVFPLIVILAMSGADHVKAQAVPPLPSETAEPAAETPAPETPKRKIPKGFSDDLELQQRIESIDAMRREIQELVTSAKMAAQRFRVSKASFQKLLKLGDCGGAASVMASFDTQQGEQGKLRQNLAVLCEGVATDDPNDPVAVQCKEERARIAESLAEIDKDRASLRRMCPAQFR